MNRRSLVAAAVRLALATAACSVALPGFAQPSYTVSAQQLQRVLEQRFPLRYPVAGLLEVEMRAPFVRLLPELNRLATELPVEAAGPALRRRYAGSVDVDFALRYERSDQSIRAHRIRVNAVRMEGLGRDGARLLDAYLRQLSEQALVEVVLHTLRAQDLALATTMGFEPGEITVTPQGLAVRFVPRRCTENPAGCPCTPASGECARP
ncbi:MAG: DUF1439 domain-containing protein [Ramlibacter sp.]|nr:DUF1439 domain-containing protein [Ramlibacter sp.]